MDQPFQGLDEVRIRAGNWEKSLRRRQEGWRAVGGGARPCVPLAHSAVREASQRAHLTPHVPRGTQPYTIPKTVCGPYLTFQAPGDQGTGDHLFPVEEMGAPPAKGNLGSTTATTLLCDLD